MLHVEKRDSKVKLETLNGDVGFKTVSLKSSKEELLESLKKRLQKSRKANRNPHEVLQFEEAFEDTHTDGSHVPVDHPDKSSYVLEDSQMTVLGSTCSKKVSLMNTATPHNENGCEPKNLAVQPFSQRIGMPLSYVALLRGSREWLYPVPSRCRPPVSLFINENNPLLSLGFALEGNRFLENLDGPDRSRPLFQSLSKCDILLLTVQDPENFLSMCYESPESVVATPNTFVGQLVSMCGLDEMINKQQTSTANDLERLPATLQNDDEARLVNRYLVAKSFQRSDANKVFRQADVRPLVWCRKTVHHLLVLHLDADCDSKPWHIDRRRDFEKKPMSLEAWKALPWLDEKAPDASCVSHVSEDRMFQDNGFKFLDIYNFLRDRLRSVWQDLTVQHCAKHRAFIESLEISFRFLLLSEELLCEEKSYNTVQNGDLMNTCLDKLLGGYADSRYSLPNLESRLPVDCPPVYREVFSTLVYRSPHEGEFWAYRIIMTLPHSLENSNAMLDVYRRIPTCLLDHSHIRLAIAAHRAFRERNPCRYFKILRQADYLLASLLHKFSGLVRVAYLEVLVSRFSRQRPRMPFTSFCLQFGFQGEDLQNVEMFCTHYGLGLSPERSVLDTSYGEWKIDYVYFGHVEYLLPADLHFKRLKCKHFRSAYLKTKWSASGLKRLNLVDPDLAQNVAQASKGFPPLPVQNVSESFGPATTPRDTSPAFHHTVASTSCVSFDPSLHSHTCASSPYHALRSHPTTEYQGVLRAKDNLNEASLVESYLDRVVNASHSLTHNTVPDHSCLTLDKKNGSLLTRFKKKQPNTHAMAVDESFEEGDVLAPHEDSSKEKVLPCEVDGSGKRISFSQNAGEVHKSLGISPHMTSPPVVSSDKRTFTHCPREILKRKHDALGDPITERPSLSKIQTDVFPESFNEGTSRITKDNTPCLPGLSTHPHEPRSNIPYTTMGSPSSLPDKIPWTLNLCTTLVDPDVWTPKNGSVLESLCVPLSNFFSHDASLRHIVEQGLDYFSWNLLFTCSHVFKDVGDPIDNVDGVGDNTQVAPTLSPVKTFHHSFQSQKRSAEGHRPVDTSNAVLSVKAMEDLLSSSATPKLKPRPCVSEQNENVNKHLSKTTAQMFEMVYRQFAFKKEHTPSITSQKSTWATSSPCCIEDVQHWLPGFLSKGTSLSLDSGEADFKMGQLPSKVAALWSLVQVNVQRPLEAQVKKPIPLSKARQESQTPLGCPCHVSCGFLMPYHVMPWTVAAKPLKSNRDSFMKKQKLRKSLGNDTSSHLSHCTEEIEQAFLQMTRAHLIWMIPFPFTVLHPQGSTTLEIHMNHSSLTIEFNHLLHCLALKMMLQDYYSGSDLAVSIFYVLELPFLEQDIETSSEAYQEMTSQISHFIQASWVAFVNRKVEHIIRPNKTSTLFVSRLKSLQIQSFCVFHSISSQGVERKPVSEMERIHSEIVLVPSGLSDALKYLAETTLTTFQKYLRKKASGHKTSKKKNDALYQMVYVMQHYNPSNLNILSMMGKKSGPKLSHRLPSCLEFRWKELCVDSLPLLLIHNWKVRVERWLETNSPPKINQLLQLFVLALRQMSGSFFFHKFFWNQTTPTQYTIANQDNAPPPIVLSERCVIRSLMSYFAQRCEHVFQQECLGQDTHSTHSLTLGDFMTHLREGIRSIVDHCMLEMKPNLIYFLPFPLHEELLGFSHDPWKGLPFPPQYYDRTWNMTSSLIEKKSLEDTSTPYPCHLPYSKPMEINHFTRQPQPMAFYFASPLSRSRDRLWVRSNRLLHLHKSTSPLLKNNPHIHHLFNGRNPTHPQDFNASFDDLPTLDQATAQKTTPFSPLSFDPPNSSESFHEKLDHPITLMKQRLDSTYHRLLTEAFETQHSLNLYPVCDQPSVFKT